MALEVGLPKSWLSHVERYAFKPWVNAIESYERLCKSLVRQCNILWIDFDTYGSPAKLLADS